MSRAAPLTTATHWSADNPTHLGGYQADANVRSGRANASPARGPTPDARPPHARTPRSRSTRAARSLPAGDRAVDDVLAAKRARQVPSRPGSRLAMPHC